MKRQNRQQAYRVQVLNAVAAAALFVAFGLLCCGGCTTKVLRTPAVDVGVDVTCHFPAFLRAAAVDAPTPPAEMP